MIPSASKAASNASFVGAKSVKGPSSARTDSRPPAATASASALNFLYRCTTPTTLPPCCAGRTPAQCPESSDTTTAPGPAHAPRKSSRQIDSAHSDPRATYRRGMPSSGDPGQRERPKQHGSRLAGNPPPPSTNTVIPAARDRLNCLGSRRPSWRASASS